MELNMKRWWLIVTLVAICTQTVVAAEESTLTSSEAVAAKEMADKVTAYASAQCKGLVDKLVDKPGVDAYGDCFTQAVIDAIAKHEGQ